MTSRYGMFSSLMLEKLQVTRRWLKPDRRKLVQPSATESELIKNPVPLPRTGIEVDDLLRALGADL